MSCHIRPYYGETLITKINYAAVERFINHCRNEKVSIPTTKKILTNFGAIMSYAVKRRYIDHNHLKEVEKPKGKDE
ncbi:MAG: phage integrase SAM-like domain-containing protein, partial [Desulfatiglandales bacterium]|nr:phage integrase SAM-like domain-containing protein [Desulfatiglandales bacterium]